MGQKCEQSVVALASVTVTTSDSNFTDPVHLGGGTDIPVHNTCVKKCSVLVYRLNEFTTGVTIDYRRYVV